MNRRDFLKKTAAIAALGTVLKLTAADEIKAADKKVDDKKPEETKKNDAAKKPDIVAVRNGEPAAMFEAAMKELGGMKEFVRKDQTVVIKPNMAWDRPPEMGATTNPDLMEALLKSLKEVGVRKVYLIDTTCDNWKNCIKSSKMEEIAKKYDAEIVCGDTQRDQAFVDKWFLKNVEIKGAQKMKNVTINKLLKECDVFINVPILKNHGGATMTCCMKNMMGVVSKDMQMKIHQGGLHQCIAEVGSYRKPDLNIVDAYRVMTKRGPKGVDASDVKLLKTLMVGKDMVALDVLAAKLLEFPVDRIGHIKEGEKLGLGTSDISKLTIKKVTLA